MEKQRQEYLIKQLDVEAVRQIEMEKQREEYISKQVDVEAARQI